MVSGVLHLNLLGSPTIRIVVYKKLDQTTEPIVTIRRPSYDNSTIVIPPTLTELPKGDKHIIFWEIEKYNNGWVPLVEGEDIASGSTGLLAPKDDLYKSFLQV
jgi:hypothetical protein